MAIKKTQKEKLFSPNFNPYSISLKKLFDGLKEEGFNPLKISCYEQKNFLNNNVEYVFRTEIEELLNKHMHLFQKNQDSNPFITKTTQEEMENRQYLTSLFDYKSENSHNKAWVSFLKRLSKEFNFDLNRILFPYFGYKGHKTPHDALSIKNIEYPQHTLNLLHKALESLAPVPVIDSLIHLGLDYKNPYSVFFIQNTFNDNRKVKCIETTPFIKFLIDDNYPTRIKLMIYENMLSQDINLIFGFYKKFEYSGEIDEQENFFSLFEKMTDQEKDNYGSILYKTLKNKKIKDIHLQENDIFVPKEHTLLEFLSKNSMMVQSKYQKDILTKTIINSKINNVKTKKRL